MDINNTPYFLLREAEEFAHGGNRLVWNGTLTALTLAQDQALRLPTTTPAAALIAWANSTPLALDSFNQIGRLSADGRSVEFNSGRGFLTLQDGELAAVSAPNGVFRDLALGGDGRAALPYSDGAAHGLVVFHLAKRWQTRCTLPEAPRRACIDGEDRVWLVSAGTLFLCRGEPLPAPYFPEGSRFEPLRINPFELALQGSQALPAGWQALAITCDTSRLYVLAHNGAGGQTILVRELSDRSDEDLRPYALAADLPFVIDLAALPGRLAALAPQAAGDPAFVQRDAVILELHSEPERAERVRERYPMLSQAVPRFVSSGDGQLRYQAEVDPDFPQVSPRPRELHALRRPQFFLEGTALLQKVLDSGQPETCWHRLYLDATIPPGCAIEVAVRVYATPAERGASPLLPQPAPLWTPLPSELAFAPSLAGQKPGQSGLFELLLQRPSGPVRRLTGRYLQIQLTLRGNGRQSPALHALRVYYPRFSYQEAYLPELFRQELPAQPGVAGPANGADIRERLLAAFEGVFTPLEARIAASEQLVHPDASPPEHLPWLAEALGTRLPPHWPVARQRRQLRETTLIQQFKGTLPALNLALDIVSDGGVQRGEVVVLENFRLRRTMATILGISMDDADHPLTLGTGMSGNSIVGDSLILSESDAREFLALFAPELANASEREIVAQFFEQYAHRVSVLLHGRGVALREQINEVLREQIPAHVQWQILETEHPFVLGLSPLLSVDTFIETTPPFTRVTLNDSYLGREGLLKNPAAFSPADINTLAG